MDLSKLLNEPEGEKEGQWRDKLYKRRNMAFDTNTRERRTLKSMQASDRRKSNRQSHQFAGRKLNEAELFEECEENEENQPTENPRSLTATKSKIPPKENTKSKIPPKENVEPMKEKAKSRKEKLAEYLNQKKKLEDAKRKHAKPAFKVGIVHHPMAPIGAGFHKPNVFSTILNSSRAAAPSPKVAARVPKVKTRTTTASVTGRVTRSKAAVVKTVTGNTRPKQTEVPSKPSKVGSKSSSKTPKRQVRASFAPENFEFKLNFPLNPVAEETNEIVEEDADQPRASTPVKVIDGNVEVVPPHSNEDDDPKVGSRLVPAVPASLSSAPKTPEPVHVEPEPRGRRRSRRISGVQPDPTLSQDELCLTPAKRAKDRSASRDRRRSQCKMCPGEHSCATPRATPRVSRKSTLPALTEVDSGSDLIEVVSSGNDVDEAVSGGNDVDEAVTGGNDVVEAVTRGDVVITEVATGGNVNTPDKLFKLARIAIEVPLPTTEKKGRSRRSLRVQKMEVEPASPVLTKPAEDTKLEEASETPVSTLSKSMDRASLESAKKEHSFKTPLKSAMKAVSKSASKSQISWITTSRASSKRKRKESPFSYSVPDMFENLEGSPLLAKLEKKVLSNENISDADFEEFEEVPAAKQIKLDKNFEEIAVEESKEKEESLDVVDSAGSSNEEFGVPYFRNLLVVETKRITEVCNNWERKLESLGDISDDIQGEIRSVIGQGRLVMAERFGQFSGLVDNCEFKRGEKETTCTDLMGFWEMIYFQVKDVDKKFEKLSEIESNNWTEVVKQVARKKMVKKPTVAAGPKKVASSGLKALIAAKRKAAEEAKAALAASEEIKEVEVSSEVTEVEPSQPKEEGSVVSKRLNIKEMIAKKREQLAKEKAKEESSTAPEFVVNINSCETKEERTFEGGFFSVTSPVRSPSSDMKASSPKPSTPSPSVKTRRSVGDKLRKSVLKETARRMSGLVSPFVSQIARRSLQGNADAQPTVLFKDVENDENDLDSNVETAEVATAPLIELFDPIAPLSSPVTKTYSKSGTSPAAKQRQVDAFDLMVVGTSPKIDTCYLEPSTPAVNFNSDVELISFDSPAESEAVTPTVSKSKIPVKTPSRRSMRVAHTPK